jgi:hypothetical protein
MGAPVRKHETFLYHVASRRDGYPRCISFTKGEDKIPIERNHVVDELLEKLGLEPYPEKKNEKE